jgi:transcriptional regulator with XRE-family HTH domain
MPAPLKLLTANQVVAYNLARIRKALGLTQQQAADLLADHVGARWSKTVYSAAERSYDGTRIRQFTADDLVAFSIAFQVPVIYFLLPPREDDREDAEGVADGEAGRLPWRHLFDVMAGGRNRSAIQLRLEELPTEDQPSPLLRDALWLIAIGGPSSGKLVESLRDQQEASVRNELDKLRDRDPVTGKWVVNPESGTP